MNKLNFRAVPRPVRSHSADTTGSNPSTPVAVAANTTNNTTNYSSVGTVEALEVESQTLPTIRADNQDPDYYHFSNRFIWLSVIFLIGAIIFSATLASSFHYVNYNEYALLQDRYGTVRLSRVYKEGRYFFPVNYNMIKFPASYIAVDLDTLVFTETGLEFDVEVHFYYRLPEENLGTIYNSFSFNYDDLVRSNAKTTIKNTAANLKFDEYFSNRTHIEQMFASNVQSVLKTVVFVDMPTDLFRIASVTVPKSILESSLDSQIALQNNDLLGKTQKVSLIRAETNRLVANIVAQTQQRLNFATNEARRLTEQSLSYYNQIEIRARAEGIRDMLTTLNFSDSNVYLNTNFTSDLIRTLAMLDNAMNTTIVPGMSDVLVKVDG